MYLPEDKSPDFELCPPGTYTARCIRFVDLGTHVSSFNKEQRKIMLSFEFPTELMADGRPFMLSNRYTWSMFEKAVLRQHLEAWRGQKFVEKDFGPGGFDIRNVLGKPCTVTVSHSESNDKTYANIVAIGPVMKGIQAPPQVNETLYVSLEPQFFEQSAYDKLSDTMKAMIGKSPEWLRLMNKQADRNYASSKSEPDPARDPRYEAGFQAPLPSGPDDYGVDDYYPVDRGGNRTHPAMVG